GPGMGFELPDRAEYTLAKSNPSLWGRMQREPAGQSLYAGGLITWQRLPPAQFTELPTAHVRTDDAFLIVASAISAPEWDGLFKGLRQIMVLAGAGLLFLTFICAWLFRGRLEAMRHLRSMNEQLESRVRERTELLEATGRLAKV